MVRKIIRSVLLNANCWIMLVCYACDRNSYSPAGPPIEPDTEILPALTDTIPYEVLGQGKLVFQRIASSSGDGFSGIYVIDIDNQTSWGIGLSLGGDPAVSPDGLRIACTHFYDYETAYDVHIMNLDGFDRMNVSHVYGQDRSPSWTPDFNEILFYAEGFEQGQNIPLYRQPPIANPTDRVLIRTFSNISGPYGPISVSILDKLAFEIRGGAIHTMDIDGRCMAAVTPEPASGHEFRSPAWSPDGGRIAYLSVCNDYGTYRSLEIIVMDADSTNPTSLVMFETDGWGYYGVWRNIISLCWSPDGAMIAFNKKQGHLTSRIYVITEVPRRILRK